MSEKKYDKALYGTGQKGRDFSVPSYGPYRDERIQQILSPKPKKYETDRLTAHDPEVDLPNLPPRPAQLLPDPNIIGSPDFVTTATSAFRKYPELRRNVQKVHQGLSLGFMDRYADSKNIPIDYLGRTNLWGQYAGPDVGKTGTSNIRSITINPALLPREAYETLLHEGAHASGARHYQYPDEAKEISDLQEDFKNEQTREMLGLVNRRGKR